MSNFHEAKVSESEEGFHFVNTEVAEMKVDIGKKADKKAKLKSQATGLKRTTWPF